MFVGLKHFNHDKCDGEEAEQGEERNDPRAAVCESIATPVQSKEQRQNCSNECEISRRIELSDFLEWSTLEWSQSAFELDEENDTSCSDCTKRYLLPLAQEAGMPMYSQLIQKHHLQVDFSARIPPMSGPRMEQTPNIAPIMPLMTGRVARGATRTTMAVAPENRPAAPNPATARPAMNVLEVFETAHMIEPTSKRLSADRNTHFTSKKM